MSKWTCVGSNSLLLSVPPTPCHLCIHITLEAKAKLHHQREMKPEDMCEESSLLPW